MIIDCFNFYNEYEILHLRLDYLYDVVDKFVIVESLDSHSKKIRKNAYVFEQHIEKYKPYLDKIIYLKLDELPYTGDSGFEFWPNENYQKNYCINGLPDLKDDDWILFSDLDEIPNKEILKTINVYDTTGILRFKQKLFYYYVNILQNQQWYGPVACKKKFFTSMMDLRNNRNNSDFGTVIENGGWHYSYIGGVDRVFLKMQSYAEAQINTPVTNIDNINKCLSTNFDLFNRTDYDFIKTMIDINIGNNCPDNLDKIIKLYPYIYKS